MAEKRPSAAMRINRWLPKHSGPFQGVICVLQGENLLTGRRSSIALALLGMFFWGSLYPAVKLGYRVFSMDTGRVANVILFAGVRFLVCGAVLVLLPGVRRQGIRLPGHDSVRYVLLIGLTGYSLHYLCSYIGVSMIPSAKAAILKQTGSLFLVCFAFLFRREDSFSWRKMISGLLGFAGIAVINLDGMRLALDAGTCLMLLAAVCSAGSMVVSKGAYDTRDPLYITAWSQLFGGLVLTALGVAMGGNLGVLSAASAAVFIYICFASCAGYVLWNTLLKHNDLSRLSMIKFTEPLFGAICAAVLLGEDVFRQPGYWIAFVLVFLGLMLSAGGKKAVPLEGR